MFDQPGKKIKENASATFWLITALLVIRLLIIMIAVMKGEDSVSLWDALVCFAVFISTYFVFLVLYAIGDMAEETAQQTKLFEQNNELLRQILEQKKETSVSASAPAVTDKPLCSHKVRCPRCGTMQDVNQERCYKCGATLKGE